MSTTAHIPWKLDDFLYTYWGMHLTPEAIQALLND
jgi:hypothetical protein